MKNFQHGAVTFKADILNFFHERNGVQKKKSQVQTTHISRIEGKIVMSVTDFTIAEEELALGGSPEQPRTGRHSVCLKAGICLLLVELCGKFTFFEVVCNMIPFCTVKLGYSNHQAAILNLCFAGASVLSPVFVGWLADYYFRRSKLLHVSLLLHFLGECPLPTVFLLPHSSTSFC